MAVDYPTGGVTYEIEVPGAPIEGNPGHFYYRCLVRRKGYQGDYHTIRDTGGKRPMIWNSDTLALQFTKDWLNDNGQPLPQ